MAKPYTTKQFIEKAQKVHGYKYDYSKVEYTRSQENVCIICPEHGEFKQMPVHHLRGHGCPYCAHDKLKLLYSQTNEIFIQKSQDKFGNKFDYSLVKYENVDTPVILVCPFHGKIKITPYRHLQSITGCQKCSFEHSSHIQSMTTENFIERAAIMHDDKYDYSLVDLNHKNLHQHICIICPEHGEFIQNADSHLRGTGCPKCHSSKLEIEIRSLLVENEITFEEQKHFDWLGKQSLDFYLPEKHIAIECQGIQHYRPVNFFGGQDGFVLTQQRDNNKKQLCEINNIRMIYYTHENVEVNEQTCLTQNELLEQITKYEN